MEHCTNYQAQRAKKDMLLILAYSKVNLTSVPRHMWWIDSDVIIHISMSIQGCLNYRKSSDGERYIYMDNDKIVEVEAIRNFRLLLETRFYLDLDGTFIVQTEFDFYFYFGQV